MVEAAIASGKLLLVGFNRRFHSSYMQLRAQLQQANAEQIGSMSSNFIFDARAWGAHLGDEAAGGGVLDDVVCHQADLLSWLLGIRAGRVAATSVSEHDTATSEVEYELDFGNGLVARCTAGHGSLYEEEVIVGLGGKILVTRPGKPPVEAARSDSMRLWEAIRAKVAHKLAGRPSAAVQSFEGQLDAFAWSIRAATPHEQSADALSGLYSVQVVEAMRESLGSGGGWRHIASTMEIMA
jgi:predicted dehydrogenase